MELGLECPTLPHNSKKQRYAYGKNRRNPDTNNDM